MEKLGNNIDYTDFYCRKRESDHYLEAFFEAFGNIYHNFTDTIRAFIEGRDPTELELDFPDVEDGVRGMQFIDTVVKSNGQWVKFPERR